MADQAGEKISKRSNIVFANFLFKLRRTFTIKLKKNITITN